MPLTSQLWDAEYAALCTDLAVPTGSSETWHARQDDIWDLLLFVEVSMVVARDRAALQPLHVRATRLRQAAEVAIAHGAP